MTIAVSLYSFEFGFITMFPKHELDKACNYERGSVFLSICHRLQFRFSCIKFVYKHWCRLKAYRLSELNFFVYIKNCQYAIFYTNKML